MSKHASEAKLTSGSTKVKACSEEGMTSFLFWNLAKNDKTFAFVARLATTHSLDVLFLAGVRRK